MELISINPLMEKDTCERQHLKYFDINFTITFNPNKFSDSDTVWDGPQFFAKYIKPKAYLHQVKFTMEKHPNKPTRWHLHGIITIGINIKYPLKRFDIITNISKWCNAKLGNSKFTWDNPDWVGDTYSTYWQYCLKENPPFYYSIESHTDKLIDTIRV